MKNLGLLFALLCCFTATRLMAQKDYVFVPQAVWKQDSVIFALSSIRVQDKDMNLKLKELINKYVYVKNDSLYASFPKDYQFYRIEDMASYSSYDRKIMITVVTHEKENKRIKSAYYYATDLLRHKIFLGKTNEKAIVYLYL